MGKKGQKRQHDSDEDFPTAPKDTTGGFVGYKE